VGGFPVFFPLLNFNAFFLDRFVGGAKLIVMNEELRKSAEIAVSVCLNVSGSDRFLVLTDPILYDIGMLLWEAGRKRTEDAVLGVIAPTGAHSAPLPEFVGDLMKRATVIAAPTFYSISHTKARREACQAGARCATLPGITKEIMIRTLQADYNEIARISNALAERLTNAKEAVLCTGSGAELWMSLEGRKGYADTGIIHKPGDFSNLPAGEAYIAPVEGSSYGTLVINGAIFDTGKLAEDDYITVEIENGYIKEIKGGRSANHLEKIFSRYTKDARAVAELGIGTNPKAIITGNILEDEKVLGTVHIAFGDNGSMGGRITNAGIHLDGIIESPTLYVDSKTIIKDGELLLK